MLKSGEWVENKYKVIDFLAAGGTSYVYEVESAVQERVVLKVAKQPTALYNAQIDNEARILAAVHHKNIPELYDKVTIKKYHHGIIMGKLSGERVSEIVDDKKQFHWGEILDIARQLAAIISVFHQKASPIVIRDIKPSNLLLTPDNNVSLIDFGASVVLQNQGQYRAIGTIGYAAPEQFENGVADLRSDLFSFGATLFYLASAGENIFTSNAKKKLSKKLPKSFTKIIMKLTETNPEHRYDSINEVITKLNKVKFRTQGQAPRPD